MTSRLSLQVRKAELTELPEMKRLFKETIAAVCRHDYTPEQLRSWSAGTESEQRWMGVIDSQHSLVVEAAGNVLGFASLKGGSYVDLMFVHKDFQRQGIAHLLLENLLAEASHAGARRVTTHASKTARPFFERNGFSLVREKVKIIGGVEIRNFEMSLDL
jgi:putative acetyltransferase